MLILDSTTLQPLIKTKFFIPTVNSNHVYRPDLIARFIQALETTLILVSAPAGAGKSSLVSTAIRESKQDCCWVSLNEQDSNIRLFLHLLITSIRTRREHFGLATEAMLQSSSVIATDQILISFVNELAEIEQNTLLILDDFHSLDSKEIDEAISFIIEHKSPALNLVIISREDPSIPLARLRACRELVEFRDKDLKFTPQEVSELFATKLELNLSELQIRSITERTEGWITGLHLAALSAQGAPDIDQFIKEFSGSHRYILDYLLEEVVVSLEPQLKKFVLICAKLPKFSAELCDELLESSNSLELIEQLNQQNLFLIALDNKQQWYRFHHLFTEALKNDSAQDQNTLFDIQFKACEWYFNHNLEIEAIEHAIRIKAYSVAINYLDQAWPVMNENSNDAQLINWLNQIPDMEIQKSALLSTYFAIALLSSDFEKGNMWLTHAENALNQYPLEDLCYSNNIQGIIFVGKSYSAISQNQVEKVFEYTKKALELLDNEEHVWKASTQILQGLMYWQASELEDAEHAIRNGHKQIKLTKDYSAIISSAYLMANIKIHLGQRGQAEIICQKNIKLAESLNFAPQGYADLYVTMAWLEVGKNRIDKAKFYLKKSYELGESAKLLESAHHWYVISAFIAAEEGRFLQASELLDEARNVKNPSPSPDFTPIELWEIRLEMLQNNFYQADQWARQLQFNDDNLISQSFAIFTLAQYYLNKIKTNSKVSELDTIIQLLNKLKKQLISKKIAGVIDIDVFLSLLYLSKNDEEKANKYLTSALNQNEVKNQRYLFFIQYKEHQSWLLNNIQTLPEATWLVEELKSKTVSENNQSLQNLAQPILSTRRYSSQEELVEPLSGRELEVLKSLRTDLSGPEIADLLFVSLNTLRTHTKNIYSKLAVNNRRAAVRRAEELNI